MKRHLLIAALLLAVLVRPAEIIAQPAQPRYALATMLVYHPEDEFGREIHDAFDSIPTPSRYMPFVLDSQFIDHTAVWGVQKRDSGYYKATFGHRLSATEIQKNALYTEQQLNRAAVGKQILSALRESGQPLPTKIFVLVNDITYVTDKMEADASRVAMGAVGGLFDVFTGGTAGRDAAKKTGEISDSFSGFTAKTHSYLYQLDWNPDSLRVQERSGDTSMYHLCYIAHALDFEPYAPMQGKYTRTQYVRTQCARSIDRNIVALGQQIEDFRILQAVDQTVMTRKKTTGCTVAGGLREGIQPETEYQIVEEVRDRKTGITSYRYVATVKAVAAKVWDNRYNASAEQAKNAKLGCTTFTKISGGDIRQGMLLIEKKQN